MAFGKRQEPPALAMSPAPPLPLRHERPEPPPPMQAPQPIGRSALMPGIRSDSRVEQCPAVKDALAVCLAWSVMHNLRSDTPGPDVIDALYMIQNYGEYSRLESVAPGMFDVLKRMRNTGRLPPPRRSYNGKTFGEAVQSLRAAASIG